MTDEEAEYKSARDAFNTIIGQIPNMTDETAQIVLQAAENGVQALDRIADSYIGWNTETGEGFAAPEMLNKHRI